MKPSLSLKNTLAGWAPIIVLAAWLAISSVLKSFSPELFCAPINPGGKELVCAPSIQVMTALFYALFFGGLIWSLAQAFRGKMTKAGWVGLALALLVGAAGIALRMHFGNEDSP